MTSSKLFSVNNILMKQFSSHYKQIMKAKKLNSSKNIRLHKFYGKNDMMFGRDKKNYKTKT